MSEWILQYDDGESVRRKLNELHDTVDFLVNSGLTSTSGTDGSSGTSGISGVSSLSGLTDVSIFNIQDKDILVYSAATNTWYNTGVTFSGGGGTSGTSGVDGLVGATGAVGADGATGADGADGATGADGSSGIDGAVGATGASGSSGIDGAVGATGASGSSGIDGAVGATGAVGADGAKGEAGSSGEQGIQGEAGSSGIDGAKGEAGTSGAQGIQGEAGSSGAQGIQGEAGTSGAQGIQGEAGSSGVDGAKGEAGTSGAQGIQGEAGVSGSSGSSGKDGVSDATYLSQLLDVNVSGVTDGQILVYSGNTWYSKNNTGTNFNFSGTTDYQILMWSGNTWQVSNKLVEPGSFIFNPVTGIMEYNTPEDGHYEIAIFGSSSGLTDVAQGDVLVFNDGFWVNSAVTFSAGGTSGSSGSSGVDGGIASFVPNSGLEFYTGGTSARTIYNTMLDTSLAMPTSVGGIDAGTTVGSLTGKTLLGLMDDLLFPTVLPTYTNPTISISSSIGTTIEVGVSISPLLTLDATKNDASAFTLLNIVRGSTISTTSSPTITSATNIPDLFGYTNLNNPNYKYTLVYTDTYTIPSTASMTPSSTVYTGNGSYASGLSKKNNKNVSDSRSYAVRNVNAPQSGATGFGSNSITISGYYPYFYGKTATVATASDIVSIIQSGSGFTKVVGTAANTLSMAFNAVGEWPWFAIFNPYPNKTVWFENASNNGSIGTGPGDLFSAGSTLSVNSSSSYWTGINFKIYVAQKITTLGTCEIRVS